jgi:phage shock protein PspC (stress-responsive transcriptional regulator)
MQKVITINLNGNAYQIEEAGYGALVGYLDGAQRQLRDNPDRMEIIGDLEQAIADKCARFRSAQKSVVTSSEVDQIIREMGPVEAAASGESAAEDSEAKAGPKAPKRLYLIREGAVLAGVCNGIAAYIGIDHTILRILFVLLAIGTKGAFIFVYIVLAIVVPSADTSEERAAAFGEVFNARELIDRAAKNLKDGSRDWNRTWRRQNRRWRRQWRKSAHSAAWAAAPPPPSPPPSPPAGYATRMLAGFMVPILSIVSAALFWICAYAVLSLVTMREAFGLLLPDDVPLWVGIVVLLFLYQSVAWPLHAARRASYQALGGPHHASVAALDGMLSLGIALLVVWFAYNNVPVVREFLRALPETFDSMQR